MFAAYQFSAQKPCIEKMLNSPPYPSRSWGYSCYSDTCLNKEELNTLINYLNRNNIRCQSYFEYGIRPGVLGGMQFLDFTCQDELIHALNTIDGLGSYDRYLNDAASVLNPVSARHIVDKIMQLPEVQNTKRNRYIVQSDDLSSGELTELSKFPNKQNCPCDVVSVYGKPGLQFKQYTNQAQLHEALNTACPAPKKEKVSYGWALTSS